MPSGERSAHRVSHTQPTARRGARRVVTVDSGTQRALSVSTQLTADLTPCYGFMPYRRFSEE
jgi:hypothetical protein